MVQKLVRPGISHLAWPAIPSADDATLLALQYQFQQSQWWDEETLRKRQYDQLRVLLEYSFRNVPFYRKRLKAIDFNPGKRITEELWGRIPVLTRREVQEAGDALSSEVVPADHGSTSVIRTSGSTGRPISVRKTQLSGRYFGAATLRHALWHSDDFDGVSCQIRDAESILGEGNSGQARYPLGKNFENWGAPFVFETGPAFLLHIHTAIEDQVKWLQRKNPSALLTFPSNLRELARYCSKQRIAFERLNRIDTVSEALTQDTRDLVREAWGLSISDMYSAAEVGYIALQCPEFEHYHIQSELSHVEVLDEEGQPCAPGQTGRVVVTPLHNVATPLVRYEVGDFAEVGQICPCGRGLPVISQVQGRVRNMLRYPDGKQVWPILSSGAFSDIEAIQQHQVIQKSVEELEVRLVSNRSLTPDESDVLRRTILKKLEHPFDIVFTYHDKIERTKSGKFEDFKSEVAI